MHTRNLYRAAPTLCLLLAFAGAGRAAPDDTLSPAARVSLITCGPGEALFEAFGHAALRVHDPLRGRDVVYNYGLFDFNQPNFYLNFARGNLLYRLGKADFNQFLYAYQYDNRWVKEQVLALTPAERQQLYTLLEINNLPQNQEYYYDYIFDNCATRPRDVIEQVLGGQLSYRYHYADTLHYTLRDLIDRYLTHDPRHAWGDLGIDLGLGADIDRAATPHEYTYQPEFLADALATATVKRANGAPMPLVEETFLLNEAAPRAPPAPPFPSPTLFFWAVFVVAAGLTWLEWRRGRRYGTWADVVLFTAVGLLGSLVVFLWFFTNHTAAAHNWNLLWAWPAHLPAAVALLGRRVPRAAGYYFLAAALTTGATLLCWSVVPQNLHEALIPLLLALTTRAAMLFWQSRAARTPQVR